jgi:hypothetical protein
MFTVSESNIRTIRPGDQKFLITDSLTVCQRASLEISKECPREYRLIIAECINNGWLKPVAHVYGKELTMDAMR